MLDRASGDSVVRSSALISGTGSMTREASIPVVLWVCAALVLHGTLGGGAAGAALVEERKSKERASIREMVRDVRDELIVVQVELPDDPKEEPPKPSEDPKPSTLIELFQNVPLVAVLGALEAPSRPLEPTQPVPVSRTKSPEAEKPKPEPETPPEEAAKKPPEEQAQKDEPEPEKIDKTKPAELVIVKDNRIAIRQVTEEDQKDNPNAPRLADKARTVEEETQAKDRSTDNVTKDPSPGSNARGPQDREGNGETDKTAQAEDKKGDPTKAPGESASRASASEHEHTAPPSPATVDRTGGPGGKAAPGGAESSPTPPAPATPGSPGGAGPRTPELDSAANGEWSSEISLPGGDGFTGIAGLMTPASPGAVSPFSPRAMGLGAMGGPGGDMSLSWQGFVKSVGEEQLDLERARMGESVRSSRKGRLDTDKFQRMLPDIENYDPSVKLGNQTALNAAQSVFASYLSTIHNAIHPVFAEQFLDGLNRLGKGHVLNEDLVTHVEIVLTKQEGKVVRRGVTRNSGSTMFDAAALEAIDRAQPFGLVAPDAIVSPDGYVYLHWEFHRDPFDACSTRNASPFLVKNPKPIKTTTPKKKPKKPPKPGEGPQVSEDDGPLLPLRASTSKRTTGERKQ